MNIFGIILIVTLLLVVLFVLWIVAIYNTLITQRNLTQEGWSGIDVQLKRRADLIPNIIESVKGYMQHEKSVLEDVTTLRAQALSAKGIEERVRTEDMLSQALSKFFAVAENYPDLKASNNFIQLQNELSEIEEQIQLARRYYNGAARNLNIKIESFPSNFVANAFHFSKAAYFEITNPSEREAPKVKF